MALAHVTKLFGVNNAGVYKLTTDPAGAPPTYGSKVNMTGVKSLTSKLGMDVKTLRGDNTLLAADAVFKDISGDLKFAKFNFDALDAIIDPAAVSDTGTTPNQKTTFTLSQADTPQPFKIEAQSKQVDYVGGDMHFVYFKCIATSIDAFGFDEENYNAQGFSYTAFPLIGTITGGPANAWAQAVANETAVAIV